MGVDVYFACHANKTVFDLGKSGNIFFDGEHDALPTTFDQLAARIKDWASDMDADSTWENAFIVAVWKFLSDGIAAGAQLKISPKDFQICYDTDDECPNAWRRAGYDLVASRYYQGGPQYEAEFEKDRAQWRMRGARAVVEIIFPRWPCEHFRTNAVVEKRQRGVNLKCRVCGAWGCVDFSYDDFEVSALVSEESMERASDSGVTL